jgi:hypothetical protein
VCRRTPSRAFLKLTRSRQSRSSSQGLAVENRIAADTNIEEGLRMWLLLLLPFIGLLWVPFYNTDTLPALFGFPFFYWYQLLWVPITAFLIWLVYRDGLRKGVK